jgi:hypothetical protein
VRQGEGGQEEAPRGPSPVEVASEFAAKACQASALRRAGQPSSHHVPVLFTDICSSLCPPGCRPAAAQPVSPVENVSRCLLDELIDLEGDTPARPKTAEESFHRELLKEQTTSPKKSPSSCRIFRD